MSLLAVLFNWRVWAALVLALGLAASHWKVYVTGKNTVQGQWDKLELSRQAEATRLSEINRARETTLQLAKERIQHALNKEKQARAGADAAAADHLVRLNTALSAGREAGTDTPAPGGTDDPRDNIIAGCAGTVVFLDQTARRLAGEKSALQAYAREVCVTP